MDLGGPFFPKAAGAYFSDGVVVLTLRYLDLCLPWENVSFWAAGLGFHGLVLSTSWSSCRLPLLSSFQCCVVIFTGVEDSECCRRRAADGGTDTKERGSE